MSATGYLLLLLLLAWPQPRVSARLETDRLIYEIGADGLNHALRNRQTGENYLASESPFMLVEKNSQRIGSTAVARDGETLHVKFGDSGVEATVRVRALPQYLTLELIAVNDRTVSFVELANLPLTLTKYVGHSLAVCRDDTYGVAVLPLNLETHSRTENAVLVAEADRRVRLEGTAVALVGSPADDLLDRIERIELAHGLPHPTLGGVWARKSDEQAKSYLFVDLSEETADATIDYAKAGGFGYIVVYDGVWDESHGTYPVNRRNFPNGDAGLKAVSDKIHRAGLKFGMHSLDLVVDKTDALVHPVPASGFMMYPDRRRTLATPIGPHDTFLPTTSSPAGLLAKADKSRYHGRDLRIGDEIVTYDDLQTSPPFGFVGCTRGAHGTVAVAHPVGAPIDNFAEFIDFYLPDVKGDLYDRVTRAKAGALDKFEFDYLYPDGTGENLGSWPEPPVWYIYNLLISKLYRFTKREVMYAHSPSTDYAWHIFSRGNTTDYVHTGVIEHFDRASVAGARSYIEDLQPFEFGWLGFLTHAADAEATRPRELEYAWSKALAYGAAMSLETTKKSLDANGRTREIFATIRSWEELKLAKHFPESVRDQMKVPGREFTLGRAADGEWQVLPVTYSPDKYVSGKDSWTVENPHRPQPLHVTIEAKPSLADYGDAANIVLLDPARPLSLNTSKNGPAGSPTRQTEGLTFELTRTADSFEVTAKNRADPRSANSPAPMIVVPHGPASTGSAPVLGTGWGCAEVILDNVKDLRQHRALGTWVEADGSGAYLHFIVEDSSRWIVRDYYLRLDFKGRRYMQMTEPAGGEVYDFAFPYSNTWAIRGLDFQVIARVYVFLSNLLPGTAARARFGRLEALRETPVGLQNPGLNVNGESITFPVQLETDWYLEYSGTGKARVFDANGFTKAEATPVGQVLNLKKGSNTVMLVGRPASSAKVTVMTRGEPLR